MVLDLGEVGLGQHELSAVQAVGAQPLGHELVDRAVGDDRARPGDAANDPDGLHPLVRLKARCRPGRPTRNAAL